MNNEKLFVDLINVAHPKGMTFLQEYELLHAIQNAQDIADNGEENTITKLENK